MAWFDAALAEGRTAFRATVNAHEFVSRILSYELAAPEYRCMFEDMRHYDRRFPPIMRLAAARFGDGNERLRDWLLERAAEHAGWMPLWTGALAAGGAEPDRCQAAHASAGAEALVETCDRFSLCDEPARLFGALTAFGWFELTVAGALHDVLGGIYGAREEMLAPLAARLESQRHDASRISVCLAGAGSCGARLGFTAGLREALPHLAAMLTAACRAAIEPTPTVLLRPLPSAFAAAAGAR